MVEVYRGHQNERFIDGGKRHPRRLLRLHRHRRRQAGQIDSKFGAVPLVDFAIGGALSECRRLGFARAFDRPAMQIAGWISAGDEVVDRARLAACSTD